MKVIKYILLITLLVACGAKDKERKEINNRDCIVEIKQEDIKYKTVDENGDPVELDDKEFKTITEGKDGYRDIVYCDNEEITYWTYEDPTHKVVSVKEDLETVDVEEDTDSTSDNQSNGGNSQSNNGNSNGSVKPPTNNGGNGNNSGNGGNTTPPVKPTPEPELPYRLNSIGNSKKEFNTFDEAKVWVDDIFYNEDKNYKYAETILGGVFITDYVIRPVQWSNGKITYTIDFDFV